MEFLNNIIERIKDAFVENTRLLIVVVAGLLFVLIGSVCLAVTECTEAKKRPSTAEETYNPTDSFVPPKADAMLDDYYYSRETDDTWTQEEVDEWFTKIDEYAVDNLSKSNDNIINEIIGVAP